VIEGWGTQTSLWVYYTNERPPLWIIPAWPIASLSIDRLFRVLKILFDKVPDKYNRKIYWVMFIAFSLFMVQFVMPTIHASLTLMALFVTCFLILTPRDHRDSVLVFAAGSGLGYFLELWGTTRYCWVYYTLQTPPFFAILAHGMAAFAFWRVLKLYEIFVGKRKNPSTL